jgi:hypothetical protein
MSCLNFPKNITGIDYNLIDKYSKISIDYSKIIYNNNNIININDLDKSSTNSEVIRLEPPYTISCSFLESDKCQKKAAFKQANNKYYCWFHMHCSN